MEFNYIDKKDDRGLINNFFNLSFDESDVPFHSLILQIGFPTIAYIFSKEPQITVFKNKEMSLKELTVTGQFYGTYDFYVNNMSLTNGITLHPTACYKICKMDMSEITDKHLLIKEVNLKLFNLLNPIFTEHKDNYEAFSESLISVFNKLEISKDKDLKYIDKAVDLILEKEGLLQVNDLLEFVPFSLKSLQVKFKKIVGLTPVKYIKVLRFSSLMRKYETNEIDLNDLIYKYNYYDHSHFSKDFKFFMTQSPKKFFNQDYPLLQQYLKNEK